VIEIKARDLGAGETGIFRYAHCFFRLSDPRVRVVFLRCAKRKEQVHGRATIRGNRGLFFDCRANRVLRAVCRYWFVFAIVWTGAVAVWPTPSQLDLDLVNLCTVWSHRGVQPIARFENDSLRRRSHRHRHHRNASASRCPRWYDVGVCPLRNFRRAVWMGLVYSGEELLLTRRVDSK
jgi:hypothetical protein